MDNELTEMKEVVTTITQLKERAETAAREAETARSKADSESGFAFNAKQNSEEHARSISQIHGTVEAELTWLTTTKKNVEENSQAITSAREACEAGARAASEARTTIEKEVTAVRAASEGVMAAQSVIEKTKTDVTAALNAVTTDSAAVAGAKATVEASASSAQTLQNQINETSSKANIDGTAIANLEAQSQTLLSSLDKVVTTANSIHERVAEYEKNLASLTESFNELHKKIERLLPNATSAGLASAFRNQKDRVKTPQRFWISLFVVSIVVLSGLGAVGLPGFWFATNSETQYSWDSILRHLATRLPLAVPLVWLAIYAGRHYALALRIGEEYAFKEAMSTSFEGYKREMAEISGTTEGEHPPIVTLCENVLRTLARRPGQIYEGPQEDITPLSPMKSMTEKVIDASSAIIKK